MNVCVWSGWNEGVGVCVCSGWGEGVCVCVCGCDKVSGSSMCEAV